MEKDIVLQHVSVRFPYEQGLVLHSVCYTFPAQQTIAVIGESGSGKSVLGKALVGLLTRASITGNIIFNGSNLAAMSDRQLTSYRGKKIFFIPQDPSLALNPAMSIGEQLTEALEYHQGMAPTVAKAIVREELQRYGFADTEEIVRAYAFQLSGGMQQRILCAMASVLCPAWIIADEPTKGLDPALRQQVFTLFRQLTAVSRSGLILITHDLRLAQKISQQVIVLQAGRVVETGLTKVIFEHPVRDYTRRLIEAAFWGGPMRQQDD